jgi:DNA modification methylase
MTTPWPADTVQRKPVAALIPFARNARTHSDAQVAQIAASIREWGWTTPVLVDDAGTLIAGHGRVLAARQLGLTDVPVMTATGWTPAQIAAYRLTDNQLALNAAWDDDLLRVELDGLKALDFDLSMLGFGDDELAALLNTGTDGLTDPDDVPEAPAEPCTRTGDIWLLGRHRLLCGDSTSPDDVAALTQGAQADLCFTSPPYLQQRDYKSGGIADWDALMQGVFTAMPVKDEAQLLVNLGMVHRDGEWLPYWDGWIAWMREQGWRRFGWYVWDQGPGLPGDWNGRLAPSHEWVFHFNRTAERARKTKAKDPRNIRLKDGTGMRRADGSMSGVSSPLAGLQSNKVPDSVVRVMRHKGALSVAGDHPAVFPVDLVSEMLTAFSDPDDVVYEPFCGSGTQLISAQKNGRTCLALEIAPQYVDVAVRRWQQFTGQTATHAATGEPFPAAQATQEANAA